MTLSPNVKKYDQFTFAVFSDCHVNQRRNPFNENMAQLSACIMDNPAAKDWSAILIPGDFFDTAMSFTDNGIYAILHWISDFLKFCNDNAITLRILKGTPSHDWNQSELFNIAAKHYPNLDFKYVSKLDIEYIERFDLNMLYVPDEWRVNNDDTWTEVQQLLKDRKLNQVDYAMTHGFFDFQVPKGMTFPHHISKRYTNIVKYHIFNGHDHDFKQRYIITVPGSFNRNRQGEEGPKGYLVCKHETKRKTQIRFIENKLAHQYIAIKCKGLSTEAALEKISASISKLRDGANVRIDANSNDDISKAIASLKVKYPTIHFDTKIEGTVMINNEDIAVARASIQLVELTPDNLIEIMSDRLKGKLESESLTMAVALLEESK